MNQILAAVGTGLVGILVASISFLSVKFVAYINKKATAVEQQIGRDKYNHYVSLGKEAWSEVEEIFRLNPTLEKSANSTLEKFMTAFKKKIPTGTITDAEIEQIRDTVAGAVNSVKSAIERPQAQVVSEAAVTPTSTTLSNAVAQQDSTAAANTPVAADTAAVAATAAAGQTV
jgi:hypothetical protein